MKAYCFYFVLILGLIAPFISQAQCSISQSAKVETSAQFANMKLRTIPLCIDSAAKCRHYKNLRNVGFGITAGGLLVTAGGLSFLRDVRQDGYQFGDIILTAFATIISGVRIGCTATGIVLAGVGSINMDKYCHPSSKTSLSIKPIEKGAALVMTF